MLAALRVDVIDIDLQHVARGTRDQPLACRTEHVPQTRDEHLDRVDGRGRRSFTPKLVDQLVDRRDLAGVEDQDRQKRALPKSAQRQRRPVVNPSLKRPQEPELQTRPHRDTVTGRWPARPISLASKAAAISAQTGW